jgi:Fanconi anemia group M protein
MINKRIFRQLEEIKQYPNYFLIIEGFEKQELYNDKNEGINSNAIRGMLLSIILKYQVPIIFTKNEEDTASFIYVLAKKQVKKDIALNPKKKSFDVQEQKQFILEAFPGIGPATAKKLLKEFKTIKNIINTPLEDIEKLIGKKSQIFKLVD